MSTSPSRPSHKRLETDVPGGAQELVGLTLGGRYVVERVLGQGGMGTVYAVRHAMIGRRYALKVLRREISIDRECVERFLQEAKIAAGICHDNLIEVVDFGEVTSAEVPSLRALRQPYFVMELLEGKTLAQLVAAHGALPPRAVAEICGKVAQGLAAAHDRGVVHRDLKPDNVFIVAADGAPRVKVLDFGVAKLLSGSGAKLTQAGTVFGTPYYMSPEQASGQAIDARADQYALGVVMYEALSGRVPFDADSHVGVMTQHLFATPEPIEAVAREPASLGAMRDLVMRCLEKRADGRFRTTHELAFALEGSAAGGAAVVASLLGTGASGPARFGASSVGAATLSPRPSSGRAAWLVAAAGLLVLAAVGLGVFALRARSVASTPRRQTAATAQASVAATATLPAPTVVPVVTTATAVMSAAPAESAAPPVASVPSAAPSSTVHAPVVARPRATTPSPAWGAAPGPAPAPRPATQGVTPGVQRDAW